MKKILTLLLVVFAATSFAQDDDKYQDLLILKADQQWAKLISKADNYTLKEKTKKDPLPYYYKAYGLYEISFDGDRNMDKFKNAYKDCLSTIGKFKRKDKDGSVYEENREFFSKVKANLVEVIKNEIESGSYKKGFAWVMKVYKFDRNEIGAKFTEAACKFNSGDKSTARVRWKEADALLKKVESIDDWKEEDLELLKLGVMESAKCLASSRQMDKAKAMIDKVAPWFEGDEDFQERYDEIVNQ